MPSSTSSSDAGPVPRPIPALRWGPAAIIAVALGVAAVAAWEWHVRARGYRPSFKDTAELWSRQRDLVRADPDATVIVGSSRARFDLDLDTWESITGERPVQLAMNGASGLPTFLALAHDPSFRGTLLVSVVPPLFFAPPGTPPVETIAAFLEHDRTRGPADRIEQVLAMGLEARLAFLQEDELDLRKHLERLPIPDRAHSALPPPLPPQLATIVADRQEFMLPKLETDPAFQERVREIWRGLMRPPPFVEVPPEIPPPLLERIVAACEALRRRGGAVVFLRLPVTGEFRAAEAEVFPRERWWDPMVAASGAPAIHFEDHLALQRWPCVEWSHLTRAHAVAFTRDLAPMVAAALRRSGGRPPTGR